MNIAIPISKVSIKNQVEQAMRNAHEELQKLCNPDKVWWNTSKAFARELCWGDGEFHGRGTTYLSDLDAPGIIAKHFVLQCWGIPSENEIPWYNDSIFNEWVESFRPMSLNILKQYKVIANYWYPAYIESGNGCNKRRCNQLRNGFGYIMQEQYYTSPQYREMLVDQLCRYTTLTIYNSSKRVVYEGVNDRLRQVNA